MPSPHAVGDVQHQVLRGRGPVEVVAEDGVRGLQLRAQLVLRPGAGAAGQELPLHLRRQREPVLATGLEIQVGVPLRHDHLTPQHLGDLGQLRQAAADVVPARQHDRQHAEAVTAHTHREVRPHRPASRRVLHERLLSAEGPALGAVVHRHRLHGVGQDGHRLQHGQSVIGHEQLDAVRRVLLDQYTTDSVEQLMRCGRTDGALGDHKSVHEGKSNHLSGISGMCGHAIDAGEGRCSEPWAAGARA